MTRIHAEARGDTPHTRGRCSPCSLSRPFRAYELVSSLPLVRTPPLSRCSIRIGARLAWLFRRRRGPLWRRVLHLTYQDATCLRGTSHRGRLSRGQLQLVDRLVRRDVCFRGLSLQHAACEILPHSEGTFASEPCKQIGRRAQPSAPFLCVAPLDWRALRCRGA